ncbi:MAG: hypothetical protein RIC55_17335 [Pirellulaceae bacterium]
MAHVPFHQRPYLSARACPPAPVESNLLGVWGFVLSLLALFLTCGILSPLALLVSLLGLLRRPRGFAMGGTVISGLATLGLALVVGTAWLSAASLEQRRSARQAAHENALRTEQTQSTMEIAQQAVAQFSAAHEEQLPGPIEGNKLVLEFSDGWGTELRYDRGDEDDAYALRSAGPDAEFDTRDDIVVSGQRPQ